MNTLATRAFLALLRLLFGWMSWEQSDRFGFAVGRLAFRLGIRRDVVVENLTQVYNSEFTLPTVPRKSPEEIRALARRVYEHTFATVMIYVRGHKMDERFFAERVEPEPEVLDRLRRFAANPKGALAIGGHIGIWDVALMKVGRMGFPNALIGKNIKNPVINDWMRDMRSIHGQKTIPPKGSRESIVAELRAGGLVTQVVDQNMTARLGQFTEVMGRLGSTIKSTPGIVRETGCSVFGGFAYRVAPGRYRLRVMDDIPWIADPDIERENFVNTQNYSKLFEAVILEMPEQWLWLHRRWKRRPTVDPPAPHFGMTMEQIAACEQGATDEP